MSKIIPSHVDISILNLLRCEPPTLAFNFFEYGGLTRSVFDLLQDVGDLEKIITEKAGEVIKIPSSSSVGEKYHIVGYEKQNDSQFVVANAHNNFSNRSDIKFLAITKVNDDSGNAYEATILGLEVYREKGNGHPIWELGLYIKGRDRREIYYGEEIIIEAPSTSKRVELITQFYNLVLLVKEKKFNPNIRGIVNNRDKLRYFRELVQVDNINLIAQEHFEQERAKWFRYLIGTLDVKKVFKFEDNYGYKAGYRVYRIELVSTHLEPNQPGGYHIQVLATTEGFPQANTSQKDLNEKVIEFGPYLSHSKALTHFLETANHYLRHIYVNAGIVHPPFTISPNFSQNDFKYATVIKDLANVPITVSSWETPYRNGNKLPSGQVHHYLQLWINSSATLRLDEGINFNQGVHPREFMGKLLKLIPQVEYGNGSALLEKAIAAGFLIKPST